MDTDLLLGMIANQKKMQRSSSMTNFIGTSVIKDAFQILEAKSLNNNVIKSNPKQFAEFLLRNADEIIAAFERRINNE